MDKDKLEISQVDYEDDDETKDGGEKKDKTSLKTDPATSDENDKDDVSGKSEYDILTKDVTTLPEEDARDYAIVKRLVDNYKSTQSTSLVLSNSYLVNVQDINSVTGTMKIELNLQLWWLSTDLEGIPEGSEEDWKDKVDSYWKPAVEFIYDVDMKPVGEPSFYIRESYSKYGIVNWYQKFKGSVKLNQDLRNFPFDYQNVAIKFGSPVYGDDAVHFEDITSLNSRCNFKDGMDLTEWDLVETPSIIPVVEYSFEDQRDISYVEIHIKIRRRSTYYITNIILPIFLCDIMLWCIFFVSPDQLADRISLVITLYLALVALNFAVSTLIPKVSYSIYLMQYIISSYGFVTAAGVQSVACSLMNTYYCGTEFGQKPCDPAFYFDWVSLSTVAGIQVIYTLVYLRYGYHLSKIASSGLPNFDVDVPLKNIGKRKEQMDDTKHEQITIPQSKVKSLTEPLLDE